MMGIFLTSLTFLLSFAGVIEISLKEALWRRLKKKGDSPQIPAEWDAKRSRYHVLETSETDRYGTVILQLPANIGTKIDE